MERLLLASENLPGRVVRVGFWRDGREMIGTLVVVLGDQLNRDSAAFRGFDPALDAVWMAEVTGESEHVPSTKMRTALFLSAMRHFRNCCRADGWSVHYTELTAEPTAGTPETLWDALGAFLAEHRPHRVQWVQPGDFRVQQGLQQAASAAGVSWEELPDGHFLCPLPVFEAHAKGRKALRLEYFYREMRERHRVLLTPDGQPEGGAWNYDADNRGSFGKEGPALRAPLPRFAPDATTRSVIKLVNQRFADHYGTVTEADFNWPVTPEQGREALADFIEHRLADFGTYQDAMWTGEPFLYHSLLSTSLNLKLLDPREVIAAAEEAYREGRAPLAAVEGFIRQILGWREYVRGIYWRTMPGYLERNALGATEPLPELFWTGETEMTCLRETVGQTLRYGYAHHIQRLMVTGLFAMLYAVEPKAIHAWYLAVYVDAVEWVELPNVLGMSQYADGGLMASKPYAATGKYLDRMSNYCRHCRFKPALATGQDACPFTTLYWDFLRRHEAQLAKNPRMALQVRNIGRKNPEEWRAISERVAELRRQLP